MKVCPICQSTYEDAVDFCFKDGAPLDSQGGEDEAVAEFDSGLAGITADDLEPPDAISLSNIPAVEPDEDAITQTLPVDLPDAEELDRSYDRLEAVEEPPERDVTGIVDPFGGYEEERFRAGLTGDEAPEDLPEPAGLPEAETPDEDETVDAADLPEPAAAPEEVPEALEEEEEEEEEAAAVAPIPPPPSTAPKPAPSPKRRPPTPRSQMADGRPRRRPQDFGQEKKSGKGWIILVLLLVAAAVVIAWQMTKKPVDDRVADASPPPAVTPPAPPAAPPAPTPEPTPEPSPEGDGDALAEGETPDEVEEPTADEVVEPPDGETDAERRRREERERRRREREEERRRLEAARATPEPTSTPAPTPTPTGAPEPPFSTGGSTPTPTVAPSDNPWATTTPAPTPADDSGNPWGAGEASDVEVTISSQPAGARISVGGRYRGTSPVKLTLGQGTHEVRVEQQGFATQTRYLKVEGAGPVGLDVVLESLAPPAAASGTLVIASAPPATLYVDGVSKGRTPLSVAITAGTHQIRLVTDDGRELNQSVTIQLTEGETVNKFFQIP